MKLKASYEHFVHLSVPSVAIPDESFIMLRIVVWRNEERLIKELDEKKSVLKIVLRRVESRNSPQNLLLHG